MSLAVGSARTLIIRFTILAVQVPTSILLARLLGVEGKGLYTLLTAIPWLTVFVMMMSQDTALTWILSSRRSRIGPVALYCMALLLAVSPLGALAYLYLVAPRVMAGVPGALIAVSALLVPLVVIRYLMLSLLLGHERVMRFNTYYLVTGLSTLLLVTAFVWIQGWGLTGALAAFITAQAVAVPLGLWWVVQSVRQDRGEPRGSMSLLELIRTSLAYGLKGHPASLLSAFNQRFDFFLMGALSDPRQVGFYAVAVAMAETIWHIPMSVHLNLFPRVSAEGLTTGAGRLPRAFRMTVMLSAAMALLLMVFGRMMIGILFGKEFVPAFIPLAILLPGVLAMACASVFESYFSGVNKRQYQSYSAGCAFALGVSSGLVLIPRWGAAGAALASTVSYILQMFISGIFFARLVEFKPREFFLPRKEDVRDLFQLARNVFRS